jgi:hypothetical protein
MEQRKRYTRWAILSAGLLVLILLPRCIGISKFVTVDEPAWLLFSANFFRALYRGEFAKTVYDYHPAVTTMWLFTAGFLSYFPGYLRVAQKYYEKYWEFDQLLQKYHKLPLTILVRGRLISILGIAGLLLLSFGLIDALAGMLTALAVILVIAFDPFFLGHSRLLNHESLMAVLILASMLAALVYLYKRRQSRYLLLSGAAAGLALLTKSPAIILLPLVGLMFFVRFLQEPKDGSRKGRLAFAFLGRLGLWLAVLCLVYVLFWPGMWVAPLQMLYTVYGNALSYVFQGSRLSVTQELQPASFSLSAGGLIQYAQMIFLKSTPVVWIGVLAALLGLGVKKGRTMGQLSKLMLAYFALLALAFLLMFGLSRGRDNIHYILTCFVSLDAIAGIGIAWGLEWVAGRFPLSHPRLVQAGLLASVLLLHGAGALPQYPYYYTYTNPIAQRLMPGSRDPDAGYGEGLELAGEYLAQKPDASQLKAMAWYAAGSFSYFFPGTTYNLLISNVVGEDYIDRMRESDYLVIYTIQQGDRFIPPKLMKALQSYTPEHVIWINGLDYVRIYRVKDFPDAFFDSIAG